MDATRAVKSKFGGCEIRLDFVSNPEFQSEDKDAEDDVVKAREDVRRCQRLLSKARDVHRSPREDEHPRWRRHAIVARLRITLWIMRVTFPREKTREKKNVDDVCRYARDAITITITSFFLPPPFRPEESVSRTLFSSFVGVPVLLLLLSRRRQRSLPRRSSKALESNCPS